MHPFLSKTFGGLSTSYFFRQMIFGSLFLIPIFCIAMQDKVFPFDLILLSTLNTLLYPYARFIYERIVEFILGTNVFILNAKFFILFKLMTMLLCWSMAIIIAPFGLGYLYYLNRERT